MRKNETQAEFDARLESYQGWKHGEKTPLFALPYYLWLALFVIAPLVLIFYQSTKSPRAIYGPKPPSFCPIQRYQK